MCMSLSKCAERHVVGFGRLSFVYRVWTNHMCVCLWHAENQHCSVVRVLPLVFFSLKSYM